MAGGATTPALRRVSDLPRESRHPDRRDRRTVGRHRRTGTGRGRGAVPAVREVVVAANLRHRGARGAAARRGARLPGRDPRWRAGRLARGAAGRLPPGRTTRRERLTTRAALDLGRAARPSGLHVAASRLPPGGRRPGDGTGRGRARRALPAGEDAGAQCTRRRSGHPPRPAARRGSAGAGRSGAHRTAKQPHPGRLRQ